MEMRLVDGSCPSCGAGLRFNSTLDKFFCSYCGKEVFVERGSGKTELSAFAAVASRIDRGVARTASELALQRLAKERAQLAADVAIARDAHTRAKANVAAVPIVVPIGLVVGVACYLTLPTCLSYPLAAVIVGCGLICLMLLQQARKELALLESQEKAAEGRLHDIDSQIASHTQLVTK
jgi:hypothetical protein